MEEILHRPRRSVLYVPGSNEKAHSKIPTLDVDALIYDLEDEIRVPFDQPSIDYSWLDIAIK